LHSKPPGLDQGRSCTRRASAAATQITIGNCDVFSHRNATSGTHRQAALSWRHFALAPDNLGTKLASEVFPAFAG
jgi:hypothetical protein